MVDSDKGNTRRERSVFLDLQVKDCNFYTLFDR